MKSKTAKELKRVADKYQVELPEGIQFSINISEHFEYPITDKLLEWLPSKCIDKEAFLAMRMGVDDNNEIFYIWSLWYADGNKLGWRASTQSEALALLAIELIKKGIVK